MTRLKVIGGLVAATLVIALLAACSTSPKGQVSNFLDYVPSEIGEWELDDKATVELADGTVSNQGYATLTYEGPDDALAFLVIQAYASVDAAEVAYAERERALLLSGLTLDADRKGGQATARIAQDGRVRYALFLESTIMVEIDALAADDATPVSDELFDELLSTVRAIYKKVIED